MSTPIVLINGTFNIVHAGHIELFEYANTFGDLHVATNTDPYLYNKYGSKTVTLEHRVKVLNSIIYIKKVLSFEEDNASKLIKEIKPNIYMKGPDYLNINIPEMDICNLYQIRYIIMKAKKTLSTSLIL